MCGDGRGDCEREKLRKQQLQTLQTTSSDYYCAEVSTSVFNLQSGICRKCYYVVAYCLRDFDRKRCRAFQIFIFNVRISLTSEGGSGNLHIYILSIFCGGVCRWFATLSLVMVWGPCKYWREVMFTLQWYRQPPVAFIPTSSTLELDTAVGALNKQAELLFPRILNTKQILWSDNEDWDWEHSLHRFYLNLLPHLLLLLHFTTRLAAVLWGDLNDLQVYSKLILFLHCAESEASVLVCVVWNWSW